MAFQLTLPTILGVIIGGVAFLFCIAAAIVVLSLRIKHRKMMMQTQAAAERRLSGYPGGHLSITDEDVARMPGTGAAMHESFNSKCHCFSAHAAWASHEPTKKLPGAKELSPVPTSRPKVLSKMAREEVKTPSSGAPSRPWPIPSHLTRANRPPAMELQPAAVSPVAEVFRRGDPNSSEQMHRPAKERISRQAYRDNQSPALTRDSHGFPGPSPDLIAFPSPDLIPKPLSYQKPRSMSHSMISNIGTDKKPAEGLHGQAVHQHVTRSSTCMKRSTSLTNQEPGPVPRNTIPPLPVEAGAIRRRGSTKVSSSRPSNGGIIWNDATSKDGGNPKTWPHLEMSTDLVKLVPPSPTEMPDEGHEPLEEKSANSDGIINGSPISPVLAGARTLKAPVNSRISVRASTCNSITRSNSSGLSESLLAHRWSRPASHSSAAKETSDNLASQSLGSHISIFDFGLPPSLPHGTPTDTKPNLGRPKNKSRSPSILQVIASNGQSSKERPYRERPSSIANENPFRWSPEVLSKGAAAQGQDSNLSAEKEQIDTKMPIGDSEGVQTSRPPRALAQSLRRPRIDPPTFSPPKSSTFNPLLTPKKHSKAVTPRSTNPSPYFSTVARLTGYDDLDSSPSSVLSTPTHKPDHKRGPPGSNPNRQCVMFDTSDDVAQWPLARQHPILSLGLRGTSEIPKDPHINPLNGPLSALLTTGNNDDSQPESLLYRFPSPPSPTRSSKSRQRPPKSQSQPMIHRPRASPVSPSRRRSPGYIPSLTTTKILDSPAGHTGTNGSSDDHIRQSVIALRRMNSEISTVSRVDKEHKRYLSLGDTEGAVLGDDGRPDRVVEEEGKGNSRPKGPRVMAAATTTGALSVNWEMLNGEKKVLALAREDQQQQQQPRGSVNGKVKGPRTMPSLVNEGAMMTAGREVRVTAGGVAVSDGDWYDSDGFLKQV